MRPGKIVCLKMDTGHTELGASEPNLPSATRYLFALNVLRIRTSHFTRDHPGYIGENEIMVRQGGSSIPSIIYVCGVGRLVRQGYIRHLLSMYVAPLQTWTSRNGMEAGTSRRNAPSER